jgi:rifampicin phosphotransferase
VLATPVVREVVMHDHSGNVLDTLAQSAEGRQFLAAFRSFLDDHGERSDKCLDLDAPAWLEDPAPAMRTIREYANQPNLDLEREQALQAAARESAIEEASARLQSYPQPVIEQFNTLLVDAQTGVFLSEEHNYWIDFCLTYHVRQVALEFGRRFAVAGVMDCSDDVFYLTFDELRDTAGELPLRNQRAVIVARRAEMIYFRDVDPPQALGSVLSGQTGDDPLSRADLRFWGASQNPVNEPGVVHGNPGSPGLARGIARIVRSLDEPDRLQPGDILVAVTTMPSWTPLFAIAGAIVTDSGGVLSHCAVVAREYRIPAVVGTGDATVVIHDGQMVEVDGTTGVVKRVGSMSRSG